MFFYIKCNNQMLIKIDKIIFFSLLFVFLIPNIDYKNFMLKEQEHPVHVSVTNIDYNSKKKSFDISIKLFADDFKKILDLKFDKNVNFENKKSNKYIDIYIKKNLKLIFNDNDINQKKNKFKGKKYKKNENVIWLYYSYKYTKNYKKIKIINTLMNDLYRDQKNLFIFTYKNIQKAIKFDKSKTEEKFIIQ